MKGGYDVEAGNVGSLEVLYGQVLPVSSFSISVLDCHLASVSAMCS